MVLRMAPRQGTGHGVGGAAICPDEVAGPGGEDEQGQAKGGDTRVGAGVGKDILRGAEGDKQRTEKEEHHNSQQHAKAYQKDNARPGDLPGPVLPPGSKIQIEIGRRADADKQGQGGAEWW